MTRSPAPGAPLDGVLVIDKPQGPTSHDVVAAVRRALGVSRVGHAGTLDPMATGVLPLLLGRATRLAQFLSAARKTYVAAVRFGWATDTDDASGTPLGSAPAAGVPPDPERLRAAINGFTGDLLQRPPAFSAKKVGGRRSYDLARRDQAVQLPPVAVTVHALALDALVGDTATLRITSSAGFYVRALARDLGTALGTGAHLAALRRIGSGEFTIESAIPLEEALAEPAAARRAVRPLHDLLRDRPGVRLTPAEVDAVRHGRDVAPAEPAEGSLDTDVVRLLAPDGALVAIARTRSPGVLHPAVVLM
jgi:tRNA pseudouridine55 synthase